jgi:hypothetical protein
MKTQLEGHEVDYEKHIHMLAERLQEAYQVAGKQSKISHELAKKYYDRKYEMKTLIKET